MYRAPRAMAVLDPLKVVLTNSRKARNEWLEAAVHPQQPEHGQPPGADQPRIVDRAADFMEDPPRKFFRLRPGGEVRLRNAFIIRCVDVIKNDAGRGYRTALRV